MTLDSQKEHQEEVEGAPRFDYKEGAELEEKLKTMEKRLADQQSFYDRKINETKAEYEARMNELQSKLIPDEKPPEKPSDYDEFDAFNDPKSSSYNYRVKAEEYKEKQLLNKIKNIETHAKSLEEKLKEKERIESEKVQYEQKKTEILGSLQKAGATVEESVQIWETFGTQKFNELKSEDFVTMIRALSKVDPKTRDLVQKRDKAKSPPPPGVNSGKHVNSMTDSDRKRARMLNLSDESYLELKEKHGKV